MIPPWQNSKARKTNLWGWNSGEWWHLGEGLQLGEETWCFLGVAINILFLDLGAH